MASNFESIVKKYQEELQVSKGLAATSFGRSLVGRNGVATRIFFVYLFEEIEKGIEFLIQAGLIRSVMQCPKCGGIMTLIRGTDIADKYRWRCRKNSRNERCNGSRSVRHGSWFTRSKLTLAEVMLLTYDIIAKVPSKSIEREYGFHSEARCDWFHVCREVILHHVETTSEKIGGEGKVVEIDESKFGKRKHHRGHSFRWQWVFGGVERGSGKTFLVPVADRSPETLIGVIKEWIEPGTTIISDCLAAYKTLRNEGYEHLTVNNSISFVDDTTGAHTNTIQSTWRQVKATLHPYNRQSDYIFTLSDYMFYKKCEAEDCDPFSKFMSIIAATDWDAVQDVESAAADVSDKQQ